VMKPNPTPAEEPLRFDRMSGLDAEQLDELEQRVAACLERPWDKRTGRPRELTLREAIIVASGYARQNIIEEVWAEIFDVSQPTISRIITTITPLIDEATEDVRPTAEEAAEAIKDAIALVDGALWPCWSWDGHRELWAGKYGTTGHGGLIITNRHGDIVYVSEPAPGCDHDMRKLEESEVSRILAAAGSVIADKGFQGSGYITPIKKPQNRKLLSWEHNYNRQISSLRAPVERAVAHIKTWRILHTDYRRPLKTFRNSFRAAIGLYFFKLAFK
jgi:transposase